MESESMIKNRWVATVASMWIQFTSGSLYTFGIYSSILKASQGYDQSTLDAVSVFKDFGANAGLLSGVLYFYVTPPPSATTTTCARGATHRFGGPRVVLFAGAVQCFLGYFLMWLSVSGLIPRPPVYVMCLYMLLAAHAQTFFNTANVVTSVRNFPKYSGTVVGIMKGCLGLSGAILIQVFDTIFNDNPTSYLLMLALLPSINSLLFMSAVRVCDKKKGDEKFLNSFSILTLLIAAYLMAIIVLKSTFTLSSSIHIILLVSLILLLASPICIAVKALRYSLWTSTASLIENNHIYDQKQLDTDGIYIGQTHCEYHQVSGGGDQEPDVADNENTQLCENLNLFQAICTANFWFLFLTTICGMGSGLATVNNISQIGASLGYSNFETSTLVSLWSIWNFLGRFGAGYMSDYLLLTKGWARPLFIAITLASMSIGHAVIASGLPGALYAGSILVGVCYGSQWSLMPTIASEIFGVTHFGTIFNTITVAGPIGSYILSVKVVGYVYDKASETDNTCAGSHCFMLSFFIMASMTFVGSLAALGLFFRTRSFYQQVLLKRLEQPSSK